VGVFFGGVDIGDNRKGVKRKSAVFVNTEGNYAEAGSNEDWSDDSLGGAIPILLEGGLFHGRGRKKRELIGDMPVVSD